MKNIVLLVFFCTQAYSQDYFRGKNLHCSTNNPEAKRLFDGGIEVLHLNDRLDKKYLAMNAEIFGRAILQDTTFCDGYFFAGYTLNLLGQFREAYAFHKMADKLSPKVDLLYKQNLAAICLKVGLIDEARENYNQMVQFFPESPEGYYGVAITSPMVGDYSNGIINGKKAADLYSSSGFEKDQVTYITGILLTLNKEYAEGLSTLKEVPKRLRKDDHFNIFYSLSLLQVSISTNDPEMKKESVKYYKKIKDKANITEEVKSLFIF